MFHTGRYAQSPNHSEMVSSSPRVYSAHEDNSSLRPASVKKMVFGAAVATAAVGFGAFMYMRYRVAKPSEYIVKTGLGIDNVAISKKTLQLPFQRWFTMDIAPTTFYISIDAMSSERIPFKMPTVWTVVVMDDPKSLETYAKRLMDKGPQGLREIVEGVIQGEARVLTANMELDKLFSDRNKFKDSVTEKIGEVLGDDFGLEVCNSNIAELSDLDLENQYFNEQKRRALQKVEEAARVDVAEAVKDGEIGEKEQRTLARQNVATYEMEATLVENERAREIEESNKNLSVSKATYRKEKDIADAEAEAAALKRKYELQKDVEITRKNQELENQRATDWVKASVAAEVIVTQSQGKADSVKIVADGEAAAKKRRAEGDAEAKKIMAEAELIAQQRQAEGLLAIKKAEAAGLLAIRQAEADGLHKLVESAGGVDGLNRYLLVRDDVPTKIAEQRAHALQGLNPRVTVWNTGSDSGNNAPLSGIVNDLLKSSMPLMDGIKEQTGYDFLGTLGIKKDDDIKEVREV